MRVVFMGTPAFAVPALDALAGAHQVVAVYTQPPRPAGRGKETRPSPVQARAQELGLAVRHPAGLGGGDVQDAFVALEADVAVVVAYGLLLPRAILGAPRFGCLNIHGSKLPRWRGAAPIQRAIQAGDDETGVCIMAMQEGLDTGPVLLTRVIPIGPEDTASDLQDRLSLLGAAAILDALARLRQLTPVPQPTHGVTYAAKIDKAEARVDWTRSAVQVDRDIRALSPFPGAWAQTRDGRLKLLRSRLADGAGVPGTVLNAGAGRLVVACGTGAVEVTQAQRAGKRPMTAAELLLGLSLSPGARLDASSD